MVLKTSFTSSTPKVKAPSPDFPWLRKSTAIQIANFCSKKNIALKDLLKTSFKGFPQKLINMKLTSNNKIFKDSLEDNMNKLIKEKLETISEPCRIIARNSGTEPVLRILVEAENKNLVQDISMQMENIAEKIIRCRL